MGGADRGGVKVTVFALEIVARDTVLVVAGIPVISEFCLVLFLLYHNLTAKYF